MMCEEPINSTLHKTLIMTCIDIPIFRQDIKFEILNKFKTISTQIESSSHIDQIFNDLIVK